MDCWQFVHLKLQGMVVLVEQAVSYDDVQRRELKRMNVPCFLWNKHVSVLWNPLKDMFSVISVDSIYSYTSQVYRWRGIYIYFYSEVRETLYGIVPL